MKCANCDADAFYIYKLTLNKEILYCRKHLPAFLEDRRKAGLLQTTDTYKAIVEEGKQHLAEEPVVEEVVAEPEPTPTPTSKKKTAKKAATKNAPNS